MKAVTAEDFLSLFAVHCVGKVIFKSSSFSTMYVYAEHLKTVACHTLYIHGNFREHFLKPMQSGFNLHFN